MRNWIIGIAVAAGVYGVSSYMRADRDETGAMTELRLFGSIIEKDGGWKVFSYVVDD